eukprot:TRINITY_DN4786_c0_g2_i5.p1 TRINITY_DN4786_c0_g2~~TRINITY_DN4786_c0_g2_i5.p1  ORF type:complete len:847 (+),score=162.76 TRINITY_DN4786_c0_g2_i5:4209-6749(+)
MSHRVKALYDYTAQEDNELTFVAGDIVIVTVQDDSGWWQGKLEKNPTKEGLFPSNYCEPTKEPPAKTTAVTTIASPSGGAVTTNYERPLGPSGDQTDSKPKKMVGRATSKGPKHNGPPNSNTRFRAWGNDMALGLSLAGIPFAIAAFTWTSNTARYGDPKFTFGAAYVFLHSVAVFLFEYIYPGSASGEAKFSIRGVLYLLLALPMYAANNAITMGLLWLLPVAAFLYSGFIKERYTPFNGPTRSILDVVDSICCCFRLKPKEEDEDDETLQDLINKKYDELQRANLVGEVVFLLIYFVACIIIFFVNYAETKALYAGQNYETYVPWAKGFGHALDFTCSIIVLPVSRTVIRYVLELSHNRTACANFLRGILFFMPLDKALEFHKVVAWTIYVAAIGHTVMHFINFGQFPDQVLNDFHLWVFASGALLCLIMVLMYGAISKSVKNGHFEIFWYSHHLFVLFFILLLLHGRNGYGPHYYQYFAFPGLVYIFERIYREYSAYRPVSMISVTNMNDIVLIVEFDRSTAFPSGFKEGQYVFINSPHLSKGEWHPFTISSAPQAATSTLHIRVQGQGSWTRGLLDYLSLMGPPKEPHFRLTTQRGDGSEQGRVLGPDGKQILRIYGPLAAPTQHISEYEVDMIIGAGIGVTPVCSTLQSIVHHLWKFSAGVVYPSHAYFFWVVSYNDIESFRWMVRIVKLAADAVSAYSERNEMTGKTFEFFIFITSAPKEQQMAIEVMEEDEKFLQTRFWGMSLDNYKTNLQATQFSEAELYQAMKTISTPEQKIGCITLVNGRPQWPKYFELVKSRHPGKEVGVAFCGSPSIGADLQTHCANFSNIQERTIFKLHKENF